MDHPNSDQIEENDLSDNEYVRLGHSRHGELSQRRDVIFKTIIRDMRKFYIEEFNLFTGYSKKKRYKKKGFYYT